MITQQFFNFKITILMNNLFKNIDTNIGYESMI